MHRHPHSKPADSFALSPETACPTRPSRPADCAPAAQTRLAAKVVAVPLPQNEADGSLAPSPETASPTKPFGTGTPPELPMQVCAGFGACGG